MTNSPNNPNLGGGYAGFAGLSASTSEYNKIEFIVQQLLGLVRTSTIVKVQSVSNSGNVAAPGTVGVSPLVNLVDGLGNAYQHGTIYNVPYSRVQAGANAIICDPQVGDIGVVVFADRDISSVKANKAQANPGSRRRFGWADAMYQFTILSATSPNQYVQFLNAGGMNIADKYGNTIAMSSAGITLTDCNGNQIIMSSSGVNIVGDLTSNGTNVSNTHVHGGVQTGGSNTSTPH